MQERRLSRLPRGIPTFDAFWSVYLREHTRPGCRALHYLAAVAALTIVAVAVMRQHWSLLFAAPVAAYGLAWVGHFTIEKNRPATWAYPWWSLRAEVRMARLALLGRIRDEIRERA